MAPSAVANCRSAAPVAGTGLMKAGQRRRTPSVRLAARASAAPEAPGIDAAQSTSMEGLNKYSKRITQPKSQGASQAMLYATGLTEQDMNKPQVGLVWKAWNKMHRGSFLLEIDRG